MEHYLPLTAPPRGALRIAASVESQPLLRSSVQTSNMTNHNQFFDTTHLRGDLKGRSLKGGAASIASNAVDMVVRIGSTMVLARLLSPGDYGLIGMVVAITALADLFFRLGLSVATIQKPSITHDQVSVLFWINVLVGTMTMVAVSALAPLLVALYHEPRLLRITLWLAWSFPLTGLSVQHSALLKRQMRFGRIAIADSTSTALSTLVTITLAWLWREEPAKYMALVAMTVTRPVFRVALIWLFCPWLPGAPRRGTGARTMLKFGLDITGFNLVNYFARNLDTILIGKISGPAALGLYSKAYQFLLLPISQLRTPLVEVSMPALSSLQTDPVRYRQFFRKLIEILAFLTMPLMAGGCVCSDLVVIVFFGGQWSGAIPLFSVMSLLGFIQPVAGMCGLVLLTLGRTRRYLAFGVMNSAAIVVSFLLGIRWGATGVALSYTVVSYLILLPTLWFCFYQTPVNSGLFLRGIARPALCSLTMGLLVLAVRQWIGLSTSAFWALTESAILGVALYLALFSLTGRGRTILADYLTYVGHVIRIRAVPRPWSAAPQ